MTLRTNGLVFLCLAMLHMQVVNAGPIRASPSNVSDFLKSRQDRSQNGLEAQRLNAQFSTLSASDACNSTCYLFFTRKLGVLTDMALQMAKTLV